MSATCQSVALLFTHCGGERAGCRRVLDHDEVQRRHEVVADDRGVAPQVERQVCYRRQQRACACHNQKLSIAGLYMQCTHSAQTGLNDMSVTAASAPGMQSMPIRNQQMGHAQDPAVAAAGRVWGDEVLDIGMGLGRHQRGRLTSACGALLHKCSKAGPLRAAECDAQQRPLRAARQRNQNCPLSLDMPFRSPMIMVLTAP